MPVNVKSFCTSVSLIFSFFAIINAQTQQATPEPAPQTANINVAKAPSSAEIMRDRISKAKAFIAVRNYAAAAYELENIRRETNDPSVNGVVNVLLMNSYLEQGDYKRAGDLLGTHYEAYKRNNANSAGYYQSVAGQVVRGARSQIERYRSFGLLVSDRNLPLEAVRDIEAMRVLLEIVIEQSKESMADTAKAALATALHEESTSTRAALARDDYDARRWRDAAADSREQMASSQSVVKNAIDLKPIETVAAPAVVPEVKNTAIPPGNQVAVNNPTTMPVPPKTAASTPAERPIRIVGNPPATVPATQKPEVAAQPKPVEMPVKTGPLEVGSLIPYATSQTPPRYPPAARQVRATGLVRVNITVDEKGEVSDVQSLSGHALLQPAARDAIRRWKFKPFTRDGQPVKATGFVNFNFSL